MSLRDEVRSFAFVRGPHCDAGTFLERLDADKRAELESDILPDVTVTHTALARWAFNVHKAKVADTSWSRHRKAECACERR